ncbi:DHHA1 domain-containing protein, partial [Treponema sp. R6D11]
LKRERLASELASMNEKRKDLEEEIWAIIEPMAYKSFDEYEKKFVLVYSDKINKGVTGLMAQRASRTFNVPAMAISVGEEICTGSIRSTRGYNVQILFEQCGNLFIDCGGHQAAGGFSMVMQNWDAFMDKLKKAVDAIEFAEQPDEEIIK